MSEHETYDDEDPADNSEEEGCSLALRLALDINSAITRSGADFTETAFEIWEMLTQQLLADGYYDTEKLRVHVGHQADALAAKRRL
ncbi:MAG TPA: hypothetical protein VKI44_08565 [Acetobacteraceae bacterium]|nr:hypothetical protein [Acetobacteraceae bacterium]